MAQIFPGKLTCAEVHRRPGKREVHVRQEVSFFAGKSRDGCDNLTLGNLLAGFQKIPGDGVPKGGQELSAAGGKDRMAQVNGFSQKIPVDFHDVTGKRGGDLDMLIHGFHPAAGVFKTVQV